MEGKRKINHHTDVPYSPPVWPTISALDQETLLELLCSLLTPISTYHSLLPKPRSKRSRKRASQNLPPTTIPPSPPSPPTPEILPHLTVGLNSTLRALQAQISPKPPPSSPAAEISPLVPPSPSPPPTLSAIILTIPVPLPILSTTIPQLTCRTSSFDSPVRLLHIPSAERRLSQTLSQPHVSIIGIMSDAPGAGPLLQFVREKVAALEVPWRIEGVYTPLRVTVLEAQVGQGVKDKVGKRKGTRFRQSLRKRRQEENGEALRQEKILHEIETR